MSKAAKSTAKLTTNNSQANSVVFTIDQAIRDNVNTAEIVRIDQADEQGPDSAGGYASATPLVCSVDSYDNVIPRIKLANLPFWRPQAGKAAILMRPQPGDKALAVIAKRDSSNVKTETKEPIPPASFRAFNPADGFLLNGFLGEAPETWLLLDPENGEIELSAKAAKIGITCRESGDIEISTASGKVVIEASDEISVNSNSRVKVKSPDIMLEGNVTITGGLTLMGGATGASNGPARFLRGIEVEAGGLKNNGGKLESNGIILETHVHTGVSRGNGSTDSPK